MPNEGASKPRQRGLTLVEMLVGVAIGLAGSTIWLVPGVAGLFVAMVAFAVGCGSSLPGGTGGNGGAGGASGAGGSSAWSDAESGASAGSGASTGSDAETTPKETD